MKNSSSNPTPASPEPTSDLHSSHIGAWPTNPQRKRNKRDTVYQPHWSAEIRHPLISEEVLNEVHDSLKKLMLPTPSPILGDIPAKANEGEAPFAPLSVFADDTVNPSSELQVLSGWARQALCLQMPELSLKSSDHVWNEAMQNYWRAPELWEQAQLSCEPARRLVEVAGQYVHAIRREAAGLPTPPPETPHPLAEHPWDDRLSGLGIWPRKGKSLNSTTALGQAYLPAHTQHQMQIHLMQMQRLILNTTLEAVANELRALTAAYLSLWLAPQQTLQNATEASDTCL
jgi:hypothetical protein